MSSVKRKRPADEAHDRLKMKLEDLRYKTKELVDVIQNISAKVIHDAEDLLKENERSIFMDGYPSVSQNLESCVDRLLVISDALIPNSECEGSASFDEEKVSPDDKLYEDVNSSIPNQTSEKNNVKKPFNVEIECLENSEGSNKKDHLIQKKRRGMKYRPVTCQYCGLTMRKYSLKRHILTRHTARSELPFICLLCTSNSRKQYAEKNSLKEHIERVHLNQFRHYCVKCGKGFPRPHFKVAHEMTCKENPDNKNIPALVHICILCPEETAFYQSKEELDIHLRKMHQGSDEDATQDSFLGDIQDNCQDNFQECCQVSYSESSNIQETLRSGTIRHVYQSSDGQTSYQPPVYIVEEIKTQPIE